MLLGRLSYIHMPEPHDVHGVVVPYLQFHGAVRKERSAVAVPCSYWLATCTMLGRWWWRLAMVKILCTSRLFHLQANTRIQTLQCA